MPVLTPEQEMFSETVRRIALEKITPIAARMEEDACIPYDLGELYSEVGWFGLLVPERFGGSGAGVTEWALLTEGISRVSVAAAQLFENNGPIVLLRLFGTEEQQARFFPALQERMACFAGTEPEAGSDIAAIRTHAVDKGGSFVINGTKQYISNGAAADVIAVLATVEPGSGRRGLRIFMVDRRDSPGVTTDREERMMGLRGASLAELTFENVEVPAENVVAGDQAFNAVQALFDWGRPSAAGMAVGVAAAAMEYALGYTLERRQFGQPVFDFQGVSFMVADMATRIEAARELTFAAAAEVDRDGPRRTELSSMAKLFATDIAMAVTTDAVQCLGGAGYLKDHPVERMMRDAKALQIFVGTNQVQRVMVSRALARRSRR
jgi:alkylation response protein AidB-like acyl-CoA dehydrogenase